MSNTPFGLPLSCWPGVAVAPTELGDALTALAAAVLAVVRRLGRVAPIWSLVGILTRGRLLAPAPSG